MRVTVQTTKEIFRKKKFEHQLFCLTNLYQTNVFSSPSMFQCFEKNGETDEDPLSEAKFKPNMVKSTLIIDIHALITIT